MAKNIYGNRDGKNGSNNTYTIPGRGTSIPKRILVEEVKKGKHPEHSIYTRDNVEYIRAKHDSEIKNNVNKS